MSSDQELSYEAVKRLAQVVFAEKDIQRQVREIDEAIDNYPKVRDALRKLVDAAKEYNRHACSPGDDGKYDDGFDAARRDTNAAIAEAERLLRESEGE